MAAAFNRLVLQSPSRLALPIATYPALVLTGAKVLDIVTDASAQFEAQAALRARHPSPFALSAMDLSAEAQAFGCTVLMSDTEVPTVTGRLVTCLEEAQRLRVPQPGEGRTSIYLDTVRRLSGLPERPFVFGGCIGPFSLAARLVGVSEAMELTLTEPELMHTLVEKSAQFLAGYAQAFQRAGAQGLIMAEPAAGLLSPRGVAAFSSAYIKMIAAAVGPSDFTILLHNCAAKLVHWPAIRETGLHAFHFGSPMDIVSALKQAPPDSVLCGNLDPTAVFVQMSSEQVRARVTQLLAATSTHRNFVISSGCDIPPKAPLSNLEAFWDSVSATRLQGPAEQPDSPP